MIILYVLEDVIKKALPIQLFMVIWLSYLFSTCLAAQSIFGKAINFLSTNNDLEVDNIVILSEPFQCDSGKTLLCESVWIEVAEDENLLRSMSFHKFLTVQNPTVELENTLNTTTSSLVVIPNYVTSLEIRNIFQNVSAQLLKHHQWLLLYPNNDENLLQVQRFVKSTNLTGDDRLQLDSQVYILAGNQTYSSLFEVYKICKETSMITKQVKIFSIKEEEKENGDAFIWKRRRNLMGCSLKVAYFDSYPYAHTNKNERFVSGGLTADGLTLYGTCVEIFALLMQEMNFTIQWVKVPDNSFGVYHYKTETWDGIMGEIVEGRADISMLLLSITEKRDAYVTFTSPAVFSHYGLYMRRPGPSLSLLTYIAVFGIDYWSTLIGMAVICAIILAVLFVTIDYLDRDTRTSKKPNVVNNIGSGVSVVGLAFASQDVTLAREITSSYRLSTKFLYFIVCLFGVLNYYTYTSGLISSLTVQKYAISIKRLKEFLDKPRYQLLVNQGSVGEAYFKESTVATHETAHILWEKQIYQNQKAYVTSYEEAQEKIVSDSRFIYFGNNVVVTLTFELYPCNITTTSYKYLESPEAFPMLRNSPYVNIFNHKISYLRETGEIDIIQKRGEGKKRIVPCENGNEFKPFDYKNIISAFIALCVGVFIALIIYIVEFLFSRQRRIH